MKECTAVERDAFSGGYSNSASADGLSTISNAHQQIDTPQTKEPMEIDGLGNNDRKCHRCGRGSHLRKDCIAKKDIKGVEITETSKIFSKPFSKPGGRGRSVGQGRGPSDRGAKTCYQCGTDTKGRKHHN